MSLFLLQLKIGEFYLFPMTGGSAQQIANSIQPAIDFLINGSLWIDTFVPLMTLFKLFELEVLFWVSLNIYRLIWQQIPHAK